MLLHCFEYSHCLCGGQLTDQNLQIVQVCFFFFSANSISAINVDHADAYPAGAVVNFSPSDGTVVVAQIQGALEPGTDYQTILYEQSSSVVTHDCAVVAHVLLLRVQTPPHPTSSLVFANQPPKWVQLEMDNVSAPSFAPSPRSERGCAPHRPLFQP